MCISACKYGLCVSKCICECMIGISAFVCVCLFVWAAWNVKTCACV